MAKKATKSGSDADKGGAKGGAEAARDIEAVSKQLEVLGRDVAVLVEMLGDLVGTTAREGRETVERKADEYVRKGRERADEAVAQVHAVEEELEARITRSPLTALLIALGLGFVIGKMSRR
jgi:ElaB/YqjD/DUF883 family membrane-anchored ribosome-binding protein